MDFIQVSFVVRCLLNTMYNMHIANVAVLEHPSLVAIRIIIRSGKPSVVVQQHIVAFPLANDNVVNAWVTGVTLCAQSAIV